LTNPNVLPLGVHALKYAIAPRPNTITANIINKRPKRQFIKMLAFFLYLVKIASVTLNPAPVLASLNKIALPNFEHQVYRSEAASVSTARCSRASNSPKTTTS
jgi:hypothetical protein